MWSKIRLGVLLIFLIHIARCAKWKSKGGFFGVRYGQDAFLECTVTGTFDGFYNQSKVKIEAPGGSRYKIGNSNDGTGKLLEILKVNEADYGVYVCKDSVSSDDATLEISALFQPFEPQSLAIGFDGKIKAEVLGMPRRPITWFHGSDLVASMDESGVLTQIKSNRFTIESHGSLLIKNVELSDAGKYSIQVTFSSAKENKTADIDVGYKPESEVKPSMSYTKTKGLELKLPCSFKHAVAIPTWTFTDKSGTVTTIDASKVDKTGYTIESVTSSDEGNYTCKSTNKFGEVLVKTEITLVITPATITSAFNDTKIAIGSDFEILCKASGVPTPNVKLFHGAKEVSTGEGSAKLSAVMSKQYTGSYKCVAGNGAEDVNGNSLDVNKSMTVTMLTPPKIDKSSIKVPITTALDYLYTFTCSATGNPTPELVIEQDGQPLTVETNVTGLVVTATYKVDKVGENDFGDLICKVTNDLGEDDITVPINRVVKAPPPSEVKQSGNTGLTYIDLEWKAEPGASEYIVYVNETREEKTAEKKINIKNLVQNEYYTFKVASVNIAGVGNTSAPVIIKTSDIIPPGKVRNIKIIDVTYKSAEINWDVPENVDPPGKKEPGLDISYKVTHCLVNNNTEKEYDCKNLEMRDTSLTLKDLQSGTRYKVTIFGVNQLVDGEPNSEMFNTKEYVKPPPPASSGKNKGMSTGVIAGIIIVIIVIILLVVDIFCCFFNHCGFTHCCFETLCSKKQNKYMPTDTKEADEREMKQKPEQAAENFV